MTAEPKAESSLARVWRGWRKEIIRGGVLFAVVVSLGLVLRNVGRSLESLSAFVPFDGDFDPDRGDREWVETFRWANLVPAGRQVWVRNTNGQIRVEPSEGPELVVIAEKSWRRSAPELVSVVAVPHKGGVTFCALWEARESRCDAGGEYQVSGPKRNDVAVRFTVHLPRGVLIDVSTVNGQVTVADAAAPVVARTVNGAIHAATSQGPIKATTVNGSIEATIRSLGRGGDVELQTVNGSITAVLPPDLNARLEASTVNGRVETAYPVVVQGRVNPRQLHAQIGTGGPRLALSTVNGSVRLVEQGTEEKVEGKTTVQP
ncbi:MAG: DUF4097 family beta strand repeat-containing protein [Gemmatimonadales bacterium]